MADEDDDDDDEEEEGTDEELEIADKPAVLAEARFNAAADEEATGELPAEGDAVDVAAVAEDPFLDPSPLIPHFSVFMAAALAIATTSTSSSDEVSSIAKSG